MFTGLYAFRDKHEVIHYSNVKIGGFRSIDAAKRAILKKSHLKTGEVRQGLKTVCLIQNGEVTFPF